MRPISFKQKIEVIELYLEGLSTNEIVEKTQISKGAVVSILQNAREGEFPDLELKDKIDELHALSVRLKKEALDLVQASIGFSFFQRLLGIGVEPYKLQEWVDFCSEISPTPPEDFIPAAMEIFYIQKATGKSYSEIISEVKELSGQREKLLKEIEDLKANEIKARELRAEIPQIQEEVQKLSAENMGISPDELEMKFKELISLEEELAYKRREKSKLMGEIEALSERQEKLSTHMEKASTNFERDMKSMVEIRNELIQIAEMKGRFEKEVKDMEWAREIGPFLRYPDKTEDPEFKLASIVVECVDKWLQKQNLGYPWKIMWGDITKHVQSKRTQFR